MEYGVFAAPLENQTGIYNTIYQAGGYVNDGTKAGHADPATLKGIKFLYDMIQTHEVSPTVAQMTDDSSYVTCLNLEK